jgi:hypothetical protein
MAVVLDQQSVPTTVFPFIQVGEGKRYRQLSPCDMRGDKTAIFSPSHYAKWLCKPRVPCSSGDRLIRRFFV